MTTEQEGNNKKRGGATEVLPPIVIDLGKAKRSDIKALERGHGKLMREVEDAVAEVRRELRDVEHHEGILPVVLIYRKKDKRGRGLFGY